MRDEKSILPVSFIQHGSLGINDVALSMPAIVGKNGVESSVPIDLSYFEQQELRKSADTLHAVIHDVMETEEE